MYLSFKKKLGFIHIPKNGGTTMSKLFYNNLSIGDYLIGGYKSEVNLSYFEKKFQISKHTSLKQLSDLGYLKDDLNNFSWFALIREPISRVKSVYKYCRKYSELYKNFKKFNNINDFIRSDFFFTSNGLGNIFAPQVQFINCNKKINLSLIKLEDTTKIKEYLINFRINYDIKELENVTKTNENLLISKENIRRVEKKYQKDFQIYKNL
jgi:hypothetical protein